MQPRGSGATLGEHLLEIPSFLQPQGQAQPLAGMWLRVTKELLREGAWVHLSGIARGSRLEGKEGAPSYTQGASPISPGTGSPGLLIFPTKAVHSGSQPPSLHQGERTLRLPCALAPQH